MYDGIVQDLIDEFGRLPGIGPKSAQRIAFHILTADKTDVERLADSLRHVAENVRFCERCFNISEADTCRICRDPRRDQTAICVVEESKDVMAIERTNEFRGLYHVLGGAISPIAGIGPEDLRIAQLMQRLADGSWRYAAYVWNADGTDAVLAPAEGAVAKAWDAPTRVMITSRETEISSVKAKEKSVK